MISPWAGTGPPIADARCGRPAQLQAQAIDRALALRHVGPVPWPKQRRRPFGRRLPVTR